MEYSVEILPSGAHVWVSARHRFGTDSLLLAAFAQPRRQWAVCDLGSGCGIVLLSLLDNGLKGTAVGVELDEEGAALLAGAAAENGFDNVQALAQDLRGYQAQRPFDMVVCNPPYFTGGLISPDAGRAAARHQIHCTLADVCATAARNLKDGGRFCLCYPATQLAELFVSLRAAGLEPKRLQLVRKTAETAPWLALVDARKAGGIGLEILPDKLRLL